jgi:hypothetical protein
MSHKFSVQDIQIYPHKQYPIINEAPMLETRTHVVLVPRDLQVFWCIFATI